MWPMSKTGLLLANGYSNIHGYNYIYIKIKYQMLNQTTVPPKSQLDDPPHLAEHTFHPEERVSWYEQTVGDQ